MRSGGAVVVVHASDNAFPKWPEYNLMIGIGGWRGRDEKSGPFSHPRHCGGRHAFAAPRL